jgi:hypothetical protein
MNFIKAMFKPYDTWRFVVVSDTLPVGWHYCICGATTTNKDKCCDCEGAQ